MLMRVGSRFASDHHQKPDGLTRLQCNFRMAEGPNLAVILVNNLLGTREIYYFYCVSFSVNNGADMVRATGKVIKSWIVQP